MAGEHITSFPVNPQVLGAPMPPQHTEATFNAMAAGAPEPQHIVIEHAVSGRPGFIGRHKVGLGLTAVALVGAAYLADSLFGTSSAAPKPPMTPSMALDYVKIDYSMPLLEAGGHSTAVADGKLVSCVVPHTVIPGGLLCATMPDAGVTVSATATGPETIEAEPGSITLSPGKDPAGEDVVIATVSDLRPDVPGQPAKPGITVNTKNIEVTKHEMRKVGSLTSNDVSDAEFKLAFDGATASYKDKTGELLKDAVAPALAAKVKQMLRDTAKAVGNTDAAKILDDRANRPIGIRLPADFSIDTSATYQKTAQVPSGSDLMHVTVHTSTEATLSPQFTQELTSIEQSHGYFLVDQNQSQAAQSASH